VVARWKLLPIVEGVVLVVAALLPLALPDYLTVFATRVTILALFALSFDLVWGYAGIMSFGQALFFGSAGYGVALLGRDLNIANVLVVLPIGMLIGLVFALLLGGIGAGQGAQGDEDHAGRMPAEEQEAADRLARCCSAASCSSADIRPA
jgi:hypothetical protein